MKILAIEKANSSATPEAFAPFLRTEALKVWELKYRRVISEIYFSQEEHAAVIVMECQGKDEALKYLHELPLVQQGLITFEVRILTEYTGFERLFDQSHARKALQVCHSATLDQQPTLPASALGAVTALVIHDLFGGDLLKARVNGHWHYYNRIAGRVYDLLINAADKYPEYEHTPASWEEVMDDTTPYLFQTLKTRFQSYYYQASSTLFS